jgi:hypothetical protein
VKRLRPINTNTEQVTRLLSHSGTKRPEREASRRADKPQDNILQDDKRPTKTSEDAVDSRLTQSSRDKPQKRSSGSQSPSVLDLSSWTAGMRAGVRAAPSALNPVLVGFRHCQSLFALSRANWARLESRVFFTGRTPEYQHTGTPTVEEPP